MNNFLLCSVALLIYICITSAHNSSSTLENSKLVVDHGSPITKTKRESANNIQFKDSTNLDMAARPLRTKRYQGYQLGSYRRCGRSVRVKRSLRQEASGTAIALHRTRWLDLLYDYSPIE
ncbi:hypothetical protein V3C99_012686 [Haemonchus contortus]